LQMHARAAARPCAAIRSMSRKSLVCRAVDVADMSTVKPKKGTYILDRLAHIAQSRPPRVAVTVSPCRTTHAQHEGAPRSSLPPSTAHLLVDDSSPPTHTHAAEKKEKKDDEIDENGHSLSTQQVETLLNILCEETDIAEIELKLDGFKMKVRRSTKGLAAAADPAPAPAAAAPAPSAAPAADTMASYDSDSDVEMEDTSAHIAVNAPKVGVMRRGRYLKGKQIGKGPVVEVGATVKKGQPLCYIEQLGTFWPVESPQAGEVGVFLVDEGEAVEYLEEIVDIAPFFGGHIIGDSKHM